MIKKGKKEINNEIMNAHPELFTYDDAAVKRVQDALLEAYCELWDFCEKNKLRLFLTGGSMLGAIRHQGFIPWDDDIDLAMPREDFERFKLIFEQGLGEKYILNAPNYSEKPLSRFPKVLLRDVRENGKRLGFSSEAECLPVDIFIIENVPEGRLLRVWKGFWGNAFEYIAGKVAVNKNRKDPVQKLFGSYDKTRCRFELAIGFFFSFLPSYRWNNVIDTVLQSKCTDSRLCGTPSGRKHYFGEIYEKKDIFPGYIISFAGKDARVFTDPHKYLKHLYGSDYMTPPPPEKREHHFSRSVTAEKEAGENT